MSPLLELWFAAAHGLRLHPLVFTAVASQCSAAGSPGFGSLVNANYDSWRWTALWLRSYGVARCCSSIALPASARADTLKSQTYAHSIWQITHARRGRVARGPQSAGSHSTRVETPTPEIQRPFANSHSGVHGSGFRLDGDAHSECIAGGLANGPPCARFHGRVRIAELAAVTPRQAEQLARKQQRAWRGDGLRVSGYQLCRRHRRLQHEIRAGAGV